MTDNNADQKREFLRHTLATLAYRVSKAVRDAPEHFATFNAGQGARTPAQILAHMGDLFDWALSMARGKQTWKDSQPMAWSEESARFFGSLTAFDDFLSSDVATGCPFEILMQGPVADAFTHTGQLAILRRLATVPLHGENFARAHIQIGQVTLEQPAPKAPF